MKIQAPLRIMSTGHLLLEIIIRDYPLQMIVDTGASQTLLSPEAARHLGLELSTTDERATGAGGRDLQMHMTHDITIAYGDEVLLSDTSVAVLDIHDIREALHLTEGIYIDGVIGADLLLHTQAIIDYGHLHIYLYSAS